MKYFMLLTAFFVVTAAMNCSANVNVNTGAEKYTVDSSGCVQ